MQDELRQLQEAEVNQHAGGKKTEMAEISKHVGVPSLVTLKDPSSLLTCLAV